MIGRCLAVAVYLRKGSKLPRACTISPIARMQACYQTKFRTTTLHRAFGAFWRMNRTYSQIRTTSTLVEHMVRDGWVGGGGKKVGDKACPRSSQACSRSIIFSGLSSTTPEYAYRS